MALPERLISPTRRRLVTVKTTPAGIRTVQQLAALGWAGYTGPAQTTADGWYIPGTDLVVDKTFKPHGVYLKAANP